MAKTHRFDMKLERDLKQAIMRRARGERVPASQMVRAVLRAYFIDSEKKRTPAPPPANQALQPRPEEPPQFPAVAPQPTGS